MHVLWPEKITVVNMTNNESHLFSNLKLFFQNLKSKKITNKKCFVTLVASHIACHCIIEVISTQTEKHTKLHNKRTLETSDSLLIICNRDNAPIKV